MAITELPDNPDREMRTRVVKYVITMSLRVACVIVMLFVQGWWLLLPVIGAVVLPYFAVVIANAKGASGSRVVERPGGLLPLPRPIPHGDGR